MKRLIWGLDPVFVAEIPSIGERCGLVYREFKIRVNVWIVSWNIKRGRC